MGYGFEVINESDYILIDQDYDNYYVAETGSFTASTVSPASLSFNAFTDIMLVRSNTYGIGIYMYSLDITNNIIKIAAVSSIVIEYIKLRRFNTISSSGGTGLEVYKADGTLAFSSNFAVGSIAIVVPIYQSGGFYTSQNFNLPAPIRAGTKRYFDIKAACFIGYAASGAQYSLRITRAGKFLNDLTLNSTTVSIGQGPPSVQYSLAAYANYMVMDI